MATTMSTVVQQASPAEDLTDEQIDHLLARATARLKDKSQVRTADVLKLGHEETYNFPKLETGQLERPYVSQEAGFAAVDAPRLVEGRQRKQAANGVRKVTDPVKLKKLAIEVRQA